MNKQARFKVGDRVRYAGYEMTVVTVCAGQLAGMYEIRGSRGIACVCGTDLVAA